MESRKGHTKAGRIGVGADLPRDYLDLVQDIFTANFSDGLKVLAKLKASSEFKVGGNVFSDEIVLMIWLQGRLAATTVYASTDFDPKASSPTVQDLLAACVDAAGSLFEQVLDPKHPDRIAQLAEESMSALERVPFEWTPVQVERFKVHLKMDKSNPDLDKMADEWLEQNDPGLKLLEEENEKAAQALFVTGPMGARSGTDSADDGDDDGDGSAGGRGSGYPH